MSFERNLEAVIMRYRMRMDERVMVMMVNQRASIREV
jgi:hypothetical protein